MSFVSSSCFIDLVREKLLSTEQNRFWEFLHYDKWTPKSPTTYLPTTYSVLFKSFFQEYFLNVSFLMDIRIPGGMELFWFSCIIKLQKFWKFKGILNNFLDKHADVIFIQSVFLFCSQGSTYFI